MDFVIVGDVVGIVISGASVMDVGGVSVVGIDNVSVGGITDSFVGSNFSAIADETVTIFLVDGWHNAFVIVGDVGIMNTSVGGIGDSFVGSIFSAIADVGDVPQKKS